MVGLAEMMAALLKAGTTSLGSREFAEALADIGGSLDASSGPDSITISGSALGEHSGRLLELLSDMARNAGFAPEEIALRKQNRKQELASELSQPNVVANAKLREVVFGEHPYSRMLPTLASIDRINRDALVRFRDRHLAPNNATLVVVGPVGEGETILPVIESRFGDWATREAPSPPAPVFPEPERSLTLVDRPGSVQADVRAGRIALNQKDPRYFPLLLANTIFGGGAASRMFNIIREERGYAYDASSSLAPRADSGLFTAITQVRNEVAGEAIEAVLAEMARIANEDVAAEELDTAKNYRSGLFAVSMETPSDVASNLIQTRLMGLPASYLEEYVSRIQAVTAAEIRSVSAEFIAPDKASVVVVGDAEEIGEELGSIGEWRVEKPAQ
jgi:zinc protease